MGLNRQLALFAGGAGSPPQKPSLGSWVFKMENWNDKLIKCISRTNSTHDGEVVQAARAANKILSDNGKTWDQVLSGGFMITDGEIEIIKGIRLGKRVTAAAGEVKDIFGIVKGILNKK